MLRYRLITGPILVIVLIAVVLLDEWVGAVAVTERWTLPAGLVLYAVSLVVVALGALELATMFDASGVRTCKPLSVLAATSGLSTVYVTGGCDDSLLVGMTVFTVLFVASLFTFARGQRVDGVYPATAAILLTAVYLGLLLGFLLILRREHSAWWIVAVIFITKSCDSGAYFTGKAIGRHKLIPWLSPGKTWEGLFGGILAAVVAGIGVSLACNTWLGEVDHIPLWLGATCGAIFAVVGQFGDLTMSLFKRGSGLKDSSSILPGLGGVLDVLDSPLMVAPVAYWMLTA